MKRMQYLPEFLAIASIHLLAVISPGPDFAMIVQKSLSYSRKAAVFSAVGLGLGILLHVSYSILGLGWLITQSMIAFTVLKILGASYLIFIGIKSLAAKKEPQQTLEISEKRESHKNLSSLRCIFSGFMTNALNPKATIFFVSIFSQVIDEATPFSIKIFYGIEMSLVTFLWFSLIAYVFTDKRFKSWIAKWKHSIERITGIALIAFGLKLGFSKAH